MNYIWDFQQQGRRSQLTISLAHYSVPWRLCPPHAWPVPMKGGAEVLRATYPVCWQLWLSEGSPSLSTLPWLQRLLFYPQCLQLFLLECGFTVFRHSEIQFVDMPPTLIMILLNYNSHTIQFTHLKCTVQWYLVFHGIVQPSPDQF